MTIFVTNLNVWLKIDVCIIETFEIWLKNLFIKGVKTVVRMCICHLVLFTLSIIHLKKNFIPTILRQFVVFVSFLILTDDTLGQKLSIFIIYNNISAWNFCLFWSLSSHSKIFTHMVTSTMPVKGCNFKPMLGTHGHWAVRVL